MAFPFGNAAAHKVQPPVAGISAPMPPKDNTPEANVRDATCARAFDIPEVTVHPVHGTRGRWTWTPEAPSPNTPEGRALALFLSTSIFAGPKPDLNSHRRPSGPCKHCGSPEFHRKMDRQPDDEGDATSSPGTPDRGTLIPYRTHHWPQTLANFNVKIRNSPPPILDLSLRLQPSRPMAASRRTQVR